MRSERAGHWVVMRLEGELDSLDDFTVDEAVGKLAASGVDLLAFDLTDLSFTDSAGLTSS